MTVADNQKTEPGNDSALGKDSVPGSTQLPGVILRQARLDSGLSVEDIAVKTGLTRRYIKALEEDDYDQLPGKVYLIGYLRRIGELVDAPIDDLLTAFEHFYGNYEGENSSDLSVQKKVRSNWFQDRLILALGAGFTLLIIIFLMAFV